VRTSTTTKPCVVCGSVARAHELALGDWTIARCTGCGTRWLSPEPDHVQMEEFDDGSGYDGALAFRDAILARHDRSLAALERVVKPGRLLDVGCGPGMLLEAARARGWDGSGVDPSSWSVERARALGFTAHLGMLEDLALEAGSFDAIALLQVVEHVPDPRPLLEMCRQLLRPGGALLVATPNPRSLLARAKREAFNYWIPPMHCVWYTPRSLARLLGSAGFKDVSKTTWSATAPGLHDGMDALSSATLTRKIPYRVRRRLAGPATFLADRVGCGTIVEQIAVKA
jgi:SAM-dependent methyltransferase